MPTIGWIDALRTYNAGMPSWCVPRKGTAGYERVMKIRQGEKPKSFKELTEELEKKTGGKPKKVVRKARISLEEPAKAEEVQEVQIPTASAKTDARPTKSSVDTHKTMAVIPTTYVAEGGSKTIDRKKVEVINRIPEIEAQIKKELAEGTVSMSYSLGWKPDTTEEVVSGATRGKDIQSQYNSVLGLPIPTRHETLDLKKLQSPEGSKMVGTIRRSTLADSLLRQIRSWKPKNVYYGPEIVYNTKTKEFKKDKTPKKADEDLLKAVADYQSFAEEVNKIRRNPIRNISLRLQFYPDGTHTLSAFWTILSHRIEDGVDFRVTNEYYIREYEIQPEFKFIRGATVESVRKEEEEENKPKEEKKPAKPKRVDTPEVVNLLAQKDKLKEEEKDLVADWSKNRNSWTTDREAEYFRSLRKLDKKVAAINSEVRKLRLAQTKAEA